MNKFDSKHNDRSIEMITWNPDETCDKFKCAPGHTVDEGRTCKICRHSDSPKVCPNLPQTTSEVEK